MDAHLENAEDQSVVRTKALKSDVGFLPSKKLGGLYVQAKLDDVCWKIIKICSACSGIQRNFQWHWCKDKIPENLCLSEQDLIHMHGRIIMTFYLFTKYLELIIINSR